MKIPRSLSAKELIKLLKLYDYEISSQKGSHIKITTQKGGEHHLAIPNHDPIKIGTLNAIIRQVAEHLGKTKETVFEELFS
ncbi:MAG TPA: type II toxin-antitoxin system HicA family toxin [Mucilaginibacter sp.]|jgi:predicted RNA binding protein YcfA (HicA-like mRNA interferase family)